MSSMNREEARVLLDEVSEIQSTTRARLHAHGWQWLVVWSVAFFGAAFTAMVPAWQEFAGVYWLFAVPIALVLTALISAREESRSPVRQRELEDTYQLYPALSLAFGAALAGVVAGMRIQARK